MIIGKRIDPCGTVTDVDGSADPFMSAFLLVGDVAVDWNVNAAEVPSTMLPVGDRPAVLFARTACNPSTDQHNAYGDAVATALGWPGLFTHGSVYVLGITPDAEESEAGELSFTSLPSDVAALVVDTVAEESAATDNARRAVANRSVTA